jgi:hypothetical protein
MTSTRRVHALCSIKHTSFRVRGGGGRRHKHVIGVRQFVLRLGRHRQNHGIRVDRRGARCSSRVRSRGSRSLDGSSRRRRSFGVDFRSRHGICDVVKEQQHIGEQPRRASERMRWLRAKGNAINARGLSAQQNGSKESGLDRTSSRKKRFQVKQGLHMCVVCGV